MTWGDTRDGICEGNHWRVKCFDSSISASPQTVTVNEAAVVCIDLRHWAIQWRQRCAWRRWASSLHCRYGLKQSWLHPGCTTYHPPPNSSEVPRSLPGTRGYRNTLEYKVAKMSISLVPVTPHIRDIQTPHLLLHRSWCSWQSCPTSHCGCTHCAPPPAARPAAAYQASARWLQHRGRSFLAAGLEQTGSTMQLLPLQLI